MVPSGERFEGVSAIQGYPMGFPVSEFGKKLLIVPPVVVGVIVFFVVVSRREPAPRSKLGEKGRAVRVIAVPSVSAVPRALGYGVAQPGAVWRAVAEVSGKLIHTSPRLKKGGLIPKGTLRPGRGEHQEHRRPAQGAGD